ncbi:hypothetical protein PTKIN_Ptkin01aG0328000 [Pterospermum kingtungense]
MEEERATFAQSLLVRQQHDDVRFSEEGGRHGGELKTSSSVTSALILSLFVAACIALGFGFVGYSSPTRSAVMEDLGLSVAEFSVFGSMVNVGSILGALASGKTTDLLGRKCALSKYTGLGTPAVVEILMSIVSTSLIDKFGRRSLLLVDYALAASLLEHPSFYRLLYKKVSDCLILLSQLYMGSYQLGMQGIPWIMVAEIFPINIEGAAGSTCSLIGHFSSWIVSYNFNFLFQWSSAAICGLNAIFVAKMVPETKGRALEEIQASITS